MKSIPIPPGSRFGKWTVLGPVPGRGDARSLCQCDCGRTAPIGNYNLRNGLSSSCINCRLKGRKRDTPDLTGRRSGTLVALRPTGRTDGHRGYLWLCQCDCGQQKEVVAAYIISERVKSCGCRWGEHTGLKAIAPDEYRAWSAMKERCSRPANIGFHNYGGRGIRVCKRWEQSFSAFYADMGKKPTPKHTLERIDNDGNYEPGNCRWATRIEQAQNKRGLILITHNGETRPLQEWARLLGISAAAIHSRIDHGWPEDRLLIPLVSPKDRRKGRRFGQPAPPPQSELPMEAAGS